MGGALASSYRAVIEHPEVDEFARGAQAVGSIEQLIAAIEQGTPPSSDAETAVLATETLMAAHQSIVENQTVTLPLASDENPLVTARKK